MDDPISHIGNSTRLEESMIRQHKWGGDIVDVGDTFLYANIINFKRSSNPRGHAHHCVMCGDKKAAIPSQNKDVCKTCDSGYWLVEAVQIVVKFCKGCKNFTRLHDFRDKPEATKCIKCRQRGRQNYFAKKGRGDAPASLLPPTGSSSTTGALKYGGTDEGLQLAPPPRAQYSNSSEFEYYIDNGTETHTTVSSHIPRVTSSRQVALQRNRLKTKEATKSKKGSKNNSDPLRLSMANLHSHNSYGIPGSHSDYMNALIPGLEPGMDHMMGGGPLRTHHERSGSFSSLLHSYNDLPLGFDDDMKGPGLGDDSGDDLGVGHNMQGSRSRSDTLLSIGSIGGVLGLGGERTYSLGSQGGTGNGNGNGNSSSGGIASKEALSGAGVGTVPSGHHRSDSVTSVGIAGGQGQGAKKQKPQGRARVGSEEWDLASIPMHHYFNLDEHMFTSGTGADSSSSSNPAGVASGVNISPIKDEAGNPSSSSSSTVAADDSSGLPPRKRRVSVDVPTGQPPLAPQTSGESNRTSTNSNESKGGQGQGKKIVEDELVKYKRPRRGSLEVIQAILQHS